MVTSYSTSWITMIQFWSTIIAVWAIVMTTSRGIIPSVWSIVYYGCVYTWSSILYMPWALSVKRVSTIDIPVAIKTQVWTIIYI